MTEPFIVMRTPTDALSSYSKISKRRSIRDVCMRNIVNHETSKPSAQQQSQDDDSTVMSTSSLYSESTTKSVNSIMSLESGDRGSTDVNGFSRNRDETRPAKQRLKKVGFSNVEIRKYAVILGDNPEISYPLSLDWAHTKSRKFPINDYDVGRTVCPIQLGANARMERLRALGFTNAELRTMERDRKMNLLKEWQSMSDLDLKGSILPPPRAVCADRSINLSKF